MRVARSPWINVSFIDGLGNQSLTITQARLTGLVLSWACLPTQPMAPDNMNVTSCTLPKLSPPNDLHP